jgi:DNA-binding transcriptional LysR family regulator
VIGTLGALAGLVPRIGHRADSLDLVAELVAAGLGVALLPSGPHRRDGVSLHVLADPEVVLRAYAVVRAGRERWGPLALLISRLCSTSQPDRSAGAIGRA